MHRLPVLFLLLFLACTGPEDAPIPLPPMQVSVLPNGMRVWMLPNPGSGLVASNIFVGAGAARESGPSAGSSHFLEHLLFNGTDRRTQEELYSEVDRLGAYNNATTKREHTHFMMVAPSELLDRALDIQADMLLHSTLPPEKFEKERGIVVEEIGKDRDRPGYAAGLELDALQFGADDPYARPVLGTPETIAGLQRDQVLAYYREHYVPSNMLALIMGDFDPDAALRTLNALFVGAAPTPATIPTPTWPAASIRRTRPVADGSTYVRISTPMPSPGDPAYPAATLLTRILVGGDGARIQSSLRDAGIETKSVTGGLNHHRGLTLLQVDVELGAGSDPDALTRTVLQTLAQAASSGVDPQEWARARAAAEGDAISQREQLHYFAILQADRLWQASAEFERSFPEELGQAAPHLPRALEYLRNPRLQVAVVGPTQEIADGSLDLPAWDYIVEGTPAPIVDPPRGPKASIERVVSEHPPTETVLPNGLTVLHAASPATRMLGLHVMVRNRSGREPQPGLADLLHRAMGQGTARLDATQFEHELEALGASLKLVDSPWIPFDDYYTTPLYSYLRLECVDEHAPAAMALLAELLQSPRLDDDALAVARAELENARAQEAANPSTRSRDAFDRALFGDHPLGQSVLGSAGTLAEVTTADLRTFHAEYFSPANLVITAVGNLDQATLLQPWRSSFAEVSATEARPIPAPAITTEVRRETLETGGEQSWLRMGRVVEVAEEDRWALPIAARLASQRMQQDLREERGWAYSLGIDCSVLRDRAVITASMGTSPQHVEAAETAMREHLIGSHRVATAEEIEAEVNRYLGRMRMRRVTRLGQAYRLTMDREFGSGLEHAQAEAAGMRGVTPADVARAEARYLAAGPLVTVVAH